MFEPEASAAMPFARLICADISLESTELCSVSSFSAVSESAMPAFFIKSYEIRFAASPFSSAENRQFAITAEALLSPVRVSVMLNDSEYDEAFLTIVPVTVRFAFDNCPRKSAPLSEYAPLSARFCSLIIVPIFCTSSTLSDEYFLKFVVITLCTNGTSHDASSPTFTAVGSGTAIV